MFEFPERLPKDGLGEDAVFDLLAALMNQHSTPLGNETAFAHMDPPTPEVAAKLVGLNAALNQNLLHPDLSPFATLAEQRVIEWIAPFFGMSVGHMCAGSTLSNLTALWSAREHGAKRVVTSADAHISIPKAAHILGLPFETVPVDEQGRMRTIDLPDLSDAALVATAGTTGRGAIDALVRSNSLWFHVDAAWAGPLRLTKHADLLDGIDQADSVAISAHKWFYQPKDSALVLFKNADVQDAISFGGSYLTTPNVGVQGSRGASAVPLLATLIAWGQDGLALQIEKNMADAQLLAEWVEQHDLLELKQMPKTAVLNWKPAKGVSDELIDRLKGISSTTAIDGERWMRQVAANPHVDLDAVKKAIEKAL